MQIDPEQRYFKIKVEHEAKFKEACKQIKEAQNARLYYAEEFLIEQGVPKDKTKAALYPRNNSVVFPKEMKEYLPKLLTKPDRNDMCRLKENYKVSKEFDKGLNAIKVPHLRDFFPTLGLGRMSFRHGYAYEVVMGYYGQHLILKGVFKDPGPYDDIYEVDTEILEELSLSEWAVIVGEVEEAKQKESEANDE